MSRIVHMCLDIRGALAWPDRKLAGMFTDKATGKPAPAWAVRDALLDHVAKGGTACSPCASARAETGTVAMDRGTSPTAELDPEIGAKLAARSELAEARGAYAAAERALNAARGRLSKARAAAKKLGLDV